MDGGLDRLRGHQSAQVLFQTDSPLFPIVVLKEPPKDEVLAYQQGAPFRREAFAVVYDRATNKTFEAVADLKAASLSPWEEMPGVQPGFLVEELSSRSRYGKQVPVCRVRARRSAAHERK